MERPEEQKRGRGRLQNSARSAEVVEGVIAIEKYSVSEMHRSISCSNAFKCK